jgi:hypothetical protein
MRALAQLKDLRGLKFEQFGHREMPRPAAGAFSF